MSRQQHKHIIIILRHVLIFGTSFFHLRGMEGGPFLRAAARRDRGDSAASGGE